MSNLDQARAWAEWAVKRRGVVELHANALAAAELIQSLPDEIIDAEKQREALEGCDKMTYPYEVIEHIEKTLLTPPLRTLSDMTPEEREACQWMQAQVFPTASTLGIITGVDEYAHSAMILFTDGMVKNVPWDHITPLPDLPKLEWPSLSVSDKSEPVSVETEDVTEESRTALPRPEDVASGEAWLIAYEGGFHTALKADDGDDGEPWIVSFTPGGAFLWLSDRDVTLISRLVPEVKP